jgi:elongation factor Ts
MMITAEKVNELRQKTGAGMLDCKKALTETAGDIEKAVDSLRKRGLAAAAKKAGRIAAEGVVSSYIHGGGTVGVLVEINCETDFVAKTEQFQNFVKDVCLHIAAQKPAYLTADEIPADVIAREKAIAMDKAKEAGKPTNILEKIAEGSIKKYYQEVCLMEQGFVKDPDKTMTALVTETVAKIGENVKIRRFVRWELGEGLEKKSADFAAEVAAAAGTGKA